VSHPNPLSTALYCTTIGILVTVLVAALNELLGLPTAGLIGALTALTAGVLFERIQPMTTTPPGTLIVGMLADGRDLHAFTEDQAAVDWAQQHRQSPARRQVLLWRVQLTAPVPLVIVPPTPARLVVEAEIVEPAESAP
jgi:hypothetical protein